MSLRFLFFLSLLKGTWKECKLVSAKWWRTKNLVVICQSILMLYRRQATRCVFVLFLASWAILFAVWLSLRLWCFLKWILDFSTMHGSKKGDYNVCGFFFRRRRKDFHELVDFWFRWTVPCAQKFRVSSQRRQSRYTRRLDTPRHAVVPTELSRVFGIQDR